MKGAAMKRSEDTETTRQAIVKAMRQQNPVTVTYVKADGTETVRTIEPYMLTRNKSGDWYVKAMERGSGKPKSWRLDRILFYTVHRTSFLLPPHVSTTQPPVPAMPETPAEPEPVVVLADGPDGEDVVPITTRPNRRITLSSMWEGEDAALPSRALQRLHR